MDNNGKFIGMKVSILMRENNISLEECRGL